MPSYFNIFESGINLLDRLDVSYEIACIASARKEYYTKILDSLLKHNDRHDTSLSSTNHQEAVRRVMTETEEEGKYAERNVNNITMDTFFQSLIAFNTQRKYVNMKN